MTCIFRSVNTFVILEKILTNECNKKCHFLKFKFCYCNFGLNFIVISVNTYTLYFRYNDYLATFDGYVTHGICSYYKI